MEALEPSGRPRLLVVDDEANLRDVLARYFGFNNFDVRTASDAGEARTLIAEAVPDLVLVDVNMPGESGLSLARWLRETHPRIGLVMLTGAADSVDRIVGLEVGADDYVTKPFETRELLARLRNLLRRLAPGPGTPAAAGKRPRFGLCELDLDGRRLLRCDDGSEVAVSAAEFDLLVLFSRHPNRPLNRDQIMNYGHNRSWDALDRSIDLRVMRLRRKIEPNPDKPAVLKTVRSVGYMYVS
ncbi:response regulator [Pseudorhodoferax sp. Leaf267]|uniref:response regulator n=1 Tax=Pseudorhodoferax sp. Leaf267 TaxID=1736316 RepID=UPI0006F5035D|nr:response regulator [Pseudorhodoferax sp. Leaf267]KQP13540.1 two-component system response regulator [Pseudorhodoferax sp. Leaf267]